MVSNDKETAKPKILKLKCSYHVKCCSFFSDVYSKANKKAKKALRSLDANSSDAAVGVKDFSSLHVEETDILQVE